MLSKEEFKQRFSDIKGIDKNIDKLIEVGFDTNSNIISLLSNSNNKLISSLEREMNDKYETINWFIYENEYGKRNFTIEHTKGKKAGTVFKFKDEDDLYDYLVNYNNLV